MAKMTIKEAEKILAEEANLEKRQAAQQVLVEAVSWSETVWQNWLENHSGVRGAYHNSPDGKPDTSQWFYDCVANRERLESYIAKNFSDGLTLTNLEKAFQALKDTNALAPVPLNPEERTGQDRITEQGQRTLYVPQETPQIHAYRTRQPMPPFTKQQLLELAGQVRGVPGDLPRFKAIVNKFGSPAINRILLSE
jgi:hypothetical protein